MSERKGDDNEREKKQRHRRQAKKEKPLNAYRQEKIDQFIGEFGPI